ncbi:hypothetical protein [Apibacter sp. HY039]|uniref:hypothetical protein n=1 Tax=Apibacter sp. HY039 TaxID=2501476 RepID=UPI000FEC1B2D|nr:hypothetical protein [Apibacter sp. HY039]
MKNFIFISIIFILYGCQKISNKNIHENSFEKIFDSKEQLDDSTVKVYIGKYEDSIRVLRTNIFNIASKNIRDSSSEVIKDNIVKDSVYFQNNLENELSLIYSSYCGFSEGGSSEKLIYTNIYHLNKLKEHTQFLSGILSNYSENIKELSNP